MTRMTKKKEVSESKVEATVKPKSSGIRSKKVTPKAESSLQKQKKTVSSRAKEEKATKKSAPLKAKAAPEKKEKAVKVASPTKTLKKGKATVKKVVETPIQTLFSDVEKIDSEIPKESKKIVNLEIVAPVAKKVETKTPILVPPSAPAPKYTLPESPEAQKKKARFESIIANDSIIESIKKLGIKEPSETLQNALPAALRGSDLLLTKPEQNDGFLVGAVTAASKLLSESLPKGTANSPSVVFLSANQKKADEIYSACKNIFKDLGISFYELNESHSEEEIKNILSKDIDIIISTPKVLLKAKQDNYFKLNNIGLCFLSGAQYFSNDSNTEDLEQILISLPQERTQKIFVANENTPIVREIAFKFLEDPEYVSLIPSQIKERSPKQFAHALSATQKFQVLLGHLKNHKPSCATVFANTKTVAEWLAFKLHGNGIKVELITTQLSQQKKNALLNSIKTGDVNVIVATDSITRSLGINKLNCLYNFDLPDSPKTFLERLARIEGSKNPIAVSFVCEDYGFNMGAIEDLLGFKIHIATPDRNYFNIKDTSDYPLEADGKVKRIGVIYDDERITKEDLIVGKEEAPTRDFVQKPIERFETVSFAQKAAAAQSAEAQVTPQQPVVAAFVPQAAATATAQPLQAATPEAPKLQPRQKTEIKEEAPSQKPQFSPPGQKGFDQRKSPQQTHKGTFDNPNRSNDKYVRRDERAKEVIYAAKMAAKAASEKRNDRFASKTPSMPKRPGILEIAVSLVQDAVQSAAVAAKDSLASNIHQNLPTLSLMLDRFKILKKPAERQQELEKKD